MTGLSLGDSAHELHNSWAPRVPRAPRRFQQGNMRSYSSLAVGAFPFLRANRRFSWSSSTTLWTKSRSLFRFVCHVVHSFGPGSSVANSSGITLIPATVLQ